MLIDWFTVGAQVVNFLILVWLLKRFLYKPILAAIDAREKRIAAELADANAKKTEQIGFQSAAMDFIPTGIWILRFWAITPIAGMQADIQHPTSAISPAATDSFCP